MVRCIVVLAFLLHFPGFRALSPPPPSNSEISTIRISCGAPRNINTSPTNTLWLKDFGYTGGIPDMAKRTSIITPQLQTLRYFPLSFGPENCYNINISNGHYSLRIFFALRDELEPLFDISIKGTQFYSLRQGWSTITEKSFAEALLFVTDSSISVCFHSTGHGDPSVLSIEILQVDEKAYNFGLQWDKRIILRTLQRLSFGTTKLAFGADYDSDVKGGDRFWYPILSFGLGYRYDSPRTVEGIINQTSIPPNFYPPKLYQSAIVGTDNMPDLSYTLAVERETSYSIWLHFAEIDYSITTVGQRVFDIIINGDRVFENIDIIQTTGAKYTALVLNRTVVVNASTLTITIHAIKGHAIINAIEIFEVIPTEFRTDAAEVMVLQNLKKALGLLPRFGWNGDPCVPKQHPWSGIDCQFDENAGKWVIDGLVLDNQGLKGVLPTDLSKLQNLQSINFSGNGIRGGIPYSIGTIKPLIKLDLSYNLLNGSIPESLGSLPSLRILNLNGNFLSGRVPTKLLGIPLHGASFNFSGNAGLCGIPGLPSCETHLSTASKVEIAAGAFTLLLLLIACLVICWKRRQNILRAQKVAAREAPYAKARTHLVRDVQMTKPKAHGNSRSAPERGPNLLSAV